MKDQNTKEDFKILNINNLFLFTFIFYYYLPVEVGVVLYGTLLYLILSKFNIKMKVSDFLFLALAGSLAFYYLLNRVGPIYEIVNMLRFFFGNTSFLFIFLL